MDTQCLEVLAPRSLTEAEPLSKICKIPWRNSWAF